MRLKLLLLPIVLAFTFVFTVKAINDPKYPFHPSQNLTFTSSNLPIVCIDLDERMADKEVDTRVPATMKIIWNKNGERNEIANTENIDYDGKIGIKYRGNSSYNSSDKKPFAVRTENDKGKKKSVSILGMGADSDWALLAPFSDKSMMRDMLLFELMKGTFDYSPSGKYCELVLNGVYQGVYIMVARVRQGPNRVDIEAPTEDSGDGVTGGYHLEIDRPDDPGFRGTTSVKDLKENNKGRTNFYQYKYPDEEDMTDAQKGYIQGHVWKMERAIAGNNFQDKDTGFRAYVDTASVMNFIISQEISKNPDGYRLSTPLYKYPDSKDKRFKFSIWDFNISMANADYLDGWSTEGWAHNLNRFNEGEEVPWMFKRILQDEIFPQYLKEEWNKYREDRLSDKNIIHKIDSLTNLLQEAQVRNFTIWNRFNNYVWPNYYIASSWNDELNFLKTWLAKRTAWLDEQWSLDTPPNLVYNGDFESSSNRGVFNEVRLAEWQTEGGPYLTTTPENLFSGKYSLSMNQSSKIYQVLTEVIPGKYTFRFQANTQRDPRGYAYIKYHTDKNGTDIRRFNIAPSQPYHLTEIEDIEVTNHFVEIGFVTEYTNGDVRLRLDEIEFFLQKDPNVNIDNATDNYRSWYVRTNKQTMSINIEDISSDLIGQSVVIYSITGQKVTEQKISDSYTTIYGVFSPNTIYLIKLGGKTQKVIF